jgi:hypothetical protein
MKLESLTIELTHTYRDAGPDNPYTAKLKVSHNENSMQVKLSADTTNRILALAGDEIASAAQVQISDFVARALAVSSIAMIEGETK